jgi:dTDP-glucose 4,6-dehydratase/UDP-glucose 4-epimerase
MKILIIGSKGFIGSHCISYFSQYHEVWQCDIVVDYTTPNYLLLDETNDDYKEIFATQNFDICINCSGAASVPDSIAHPQRDFNLNVVSVYKQLDALRLFTPACKYVHLSSAAVYGNPTSLPIQESHALAPISPYGKHKKMAEEVCEEFYSQFGIKTISLRVFSAYGTGLKKQLFWDLYKKYLNGGSIELYGTGRESRDFIYVTDLVQAINCVINNGAFNGTAINIANGEEVSIEEVASLFYGHIDKKIKPVFGGEERKGDPINWVADINGLQKLGYERKVTMDEGLSNYITWRKELG